MVEDADRKAAFRRWARENHPDVGGDPRHFATGVLAFQEGRWEEFAPSSRTTVYGRRSARGIARVIVAAQRWNERRRRPPRVR